MGEMLDCEQSLSSKIRGKERKTSKRANATVSVTWVPWAASSVGVGKNTSTVMRLTLISDNNVLLCSVLKAIVLVLNFYLAVSYSHWLSCNCFVFCWEGMFLF